MAQTSSETLSDEALLALAYTPPNMRAALTKLLELDARLARIVAATTEPMLGQMRLAWWRDTLGMDGSERPRGDAVMDGLGAVWGGKEAPLIALIDGWEWMLSEPPLSHEAASGFIDGRARALGGLTLFGETEDKLRETVEAAARIWAVADAAHHIGETSERQVLLNLADEFPRPPALPNPYRGIAVLSALGRRALKAGGVPLMEGRAAALVALRAGLAGR